MAIMMLTERRLWLWFSVISKTISVTLIIIFPTGTGKVTEFHLTELILPRKMAINLLLHWIAESKPTKRSNTPGKRDIDFIICDHHTPGSEIPFADAVIDAKRTDCHYPFKELSGCGVGFKLIQAFQKEIQATFHEIPQYLDLVAVSIASDIVPIKGENRVLASLRT